VLERDEPQVRVKRILVATDFSDASSAALHYATGIARQLDVPLVLTHVVAPVVVPPRWQTYVADVDEERTRAAQARLAGLVAPLRGSIECETVVSIGRPAESIAATAEERDAGLISMGLLGEQTGHAPRPGSVAYRVLCLSHVPVLVVPPSSLTGATS
jgi:nucleotide-binding universal stress UspA family protein